jgi:hypothetical protein
MEQKIGQITPEEQADIDAFFDEIGVPRPLPKPRVVTREDETCPVRDADVHVSRADVNAKGEDKIVEVRRPDYVTINMAAYEAQVRDKLEARREEANSIHSGWASMGRQTQKMIKGLPSTEALKFLEM